MKKKKTFYPVDTTIPGGEVKANDFNTPVPISIKFKFLSSHFKL